MARPRLYTQEEKEIKKKEWRKKSYLNKSKSRISKCLYCSEKFKTYKYSRTKCCSQSCATKLQFLQPKKINRKKLLNLWDRYHNSKARKSTYERIILMLYGEKFTSNKQNDIYNLFIPNNLKHE